MIDMTATQQNELSIGDIKDRKGNVIPDAVIDGEVSWTTDNVGVLSLEPSQDTRSCKVAAIGPLTQPGMPARVFATFDVDPTAGVRHIIGQVGYNITAGDAATVDLVGSAPTEQPVPN